LPQITVDAINAGLSTGTGRNNDPVEQAASELNELAQAKWQLHRFLEQVKKIEGSNNPGDVRRRAVGTLDVVMQLVLCLPSFNGLLVPIHGLWLGLMGLESGVIAPVFQHKPRKSGRMRT